MNGTGYEVSGWMLTGFQAQVGLWVWVVLVLLYGFYRSLTGSDPDTIRPAGPVV